MMIVSIAGGAPEAGVGVGGAIVILGLAFIVRSLVVRTPDTISTSNPAPRWAAWTSSTPPSSRCCSRATGRAPETSSTWSS
jgi:hypothetical protein